MELVIIFAVMGLLCIAVSIGSFAYKNYVLTMDASLTALGFICLALVGLLFV